MITAAYPGRGNTCKTEPQYMYNKGIRLKFVNPPGENYVIEFEDGEQITPHNDVIMIPDKYFRTGKDIEMWLAVTGGKGGPVNTLSKIVVPILWRPERIDGA